MNKLFAVVKNELIRYFTSPLAYVYLLSFLILNGSFAFYFGDFFNRGQADLQAMFEFQPWIYLLFIPGISMRLWAEEFRQKTIIQIATMPISITKLVWGKFIASWLFCGFALILTMPFWISINILGHPDNAVILSGYIGSFILAGCMLAVSQIMSALTKSQVIALVLSVIANLFFFLSGLEYVLAFFRIFLSDTFIDTIASLSFLTHFRLLTFGLWELQTIIFAFSLIVFANYTTAMIVNFRTSGNSGWLKSNSKLYTCVAWFMLLYAFFGINIFAETFTAAIQYDASQEKNFTLTDNTKKILQNLPETVTAKLYFSPILAQRNSYLREKFNNLRVLLKKYKTAAKGKFEYKIYYPEFLSKQEDIALADGLQAIPLVDLNQNALFGLTVEDTLQNKQVIPFFAQNNQSALEQELTQKIYLLGHTRKTLGIITSLPVFGSVADEGSVLLQPWEIITQLQQYYRVRNITNPEDFENQSFDVLILLLPDKLPPPLTEKIKEYSRSGGKIILVLDNAHESVHLYQPNTPLLPASDLGELEKFWGLQLYQEYVAADLDNSITVDSTQNYAKNPVFTQDVIQFKVKREDMNPQHPVTRNLQEIMLASTSIVMPDKDAFEQNKIVFYPLLRAGRISSLMNKKVVTDGLNPQQVLQYFNADDNQKILAAEVIGTQPDNPFDLIVFADSDFLYDSFWANKRFFLENEYVTDVVDNANLFFNAIDYLSGETEIIGLRGKRALNRHFQDIETLRRLNSLQYKKAENEIFEQIDEAKLALQEVWNKKDFEQRENFTADELAAIAGLREKLNALRTSLSQLRVQAYNDIKLIYQHFLFFNVWLIPVILALILLLVKLFFLIKSRNKLSFACKINKKLALLALICLSLLSAAILTVYLCNRSSIDEFENKKAFPEISKNINHIDTIEIKSQQTTLTFYKDDGLWKLREVSDFPVFQERIRRLLTTVSDATFFARKSNKAENLALFNLLPVEDTNSKALRLTFKNGADHIKSFLLGDINIDIGRGSKAAYMRFDDQFQVWEINADFIDMDTDWHKWTYSHLWDLRFGRLYDRNNNPKNEMNLANIMALMLNTELLETTDIPNEKPLLKFDLFIENGNYASICFYKKANQGLVSYIFDENNPNKHLKLFASYFQNRAAVVDLDKLEKIVELLK
ncbi:MAG: Gldg family protein [Alphaproteobacteria bacterium]|nr:Gldg family protein [Alphaproteobacteria bacterium]